MQNPTIKDFANGIAGHLFYQGGHDGFANQLQFLICMIGSNPFAQIFPAIFG